MPWLLVDRCSTAAAAASKREDARALWEDGASWREGKEEAAAGESRVFSAAGEQSRARPIDDVRRRCTPVVVIIFLYVFLAVFY